MDPLGDHLSQRRSNDTAAQEDQRADAVYQRVARQEQLRVAGGQSDRKAQSEGQQ
jgi:hypothetical protein